jgi:hypothetical protein
VSKNLIINTDLKLTGLVVHIMKHMDTLLLPRPHVTPIQLNVLTVAVIWLMVTGQSGIGLVLEIDLVLNLMLLSLWYIDHGN